MGTSIITVIHVAAQTESTPQHKGIVPRPFLDTDKAPNRTSSEETAGTANKHTHDTTFVCQCDQYWEVQKCNSHISGSKSEGVRVLSGRLSLLTWRLVVAEILWDQYNRIYRWHNNCNQWEIPTTVGDATNSPR